MAKKGWNFYPSAISHQTFIKKAWQGTHSCHAEQNTFSFYWVETSCFGMKPDVAVATQSHCHQRLKKISKGVGATDEHGQTRMLWQSTWSCHDAVAKHQKLPRRRGKAPGVDTKAESLSSFA